MRFEVPQFIDVEDKIFGPLTFKQFIYLVGGAGLGFTSFKLIPFPIWIPVTLGFVVFGLLLAFYKINNRPFIEIAQSYISFKLKGKLYLWKRAPNKSVPVVTITPTSTDSPVTKDVTMDRIKSLAQNLDILDTYEQ
jgi:hypothetical protein